MGVLEISRNIDVEIRLYRSFIRCIAMIYGHEIREKGKCPLRYSGLIILQ
jgi:hypothetical protein